MDPEEIFQEMIASRQFTNSNSEFYSITSNSHVKYKIKISLQTLDFKALGLPAIAPATNKDKGEL